jgi:hypothetical protein
VVMGAVPFYSGAAEVGDEPMEEATQWHEVVEGRGGRAAGNGPAATHEGGRRVGVMSALKTGEVGEAGRWGPGNSAGCGQFKFDSNFQFKRIQTSINHFKL